MKYSFSLFVLFSILLSACSFSKEKKSAAASMFGTLKKHTKKSAPMGQSPEMVHDFRAYLATKYTDTTLVYYDIYDMIIGDLNGDKQNDFSMQYSAPVENSDCLQCWEIYHAYFEQKNHHYYFIQEEKVGEGSGGNGSFIQIDSIRSGTVYRSFMNIEEGDDVSMQKRDVLYYENGQLKKTGEAKTL